MPATLGNLKKEGSRISCTEKNKPGKFILANPTGGHRPPQIVAQKLSPKFSERGWTHKEKRGERLKLLHSQKKNSSVSHISSGFP